MMLFNKGLNKETLKYFTDKIEVLEYRLKVLTSQNENFRNSLRNQTNADLLFKTLKQSGLIQEVFDNEVKNENS